LIQNTVEIPCFELYERKINAAKAGSNKQSRGRKGKKPVSVIDVDQTPLGKNATAITASAGADSQNGQTGELVPENDLKFCFESQLRMMESMSKDMKEDMKGHEGAEARAEDSGFDAVIEQVEGEIVMDEDGVMSFA